MQIHASADQLKGSLRAFAPMLLPMAAFYGLVLLFGLRLLNDKLLGGRFEPSVISWTSLGIVVVLVLLYVRYLLRTIGSCKLSLDGRTLVVKAVRTGGWAAVEVQYNLSEIKAVALGVPANALTSISESVGRLSAKGRRYAELGAQLRQGRLVIVPQTGKPTTFHYVNYAFTPDDLVQFLIALDTAGVPVVLS